VIPIAYEGTRAALASDVKLSRRNVLKGALALAGLKALGCAAPFDDDPAVSWGDGKADGGSCAPSATSWELARQKITSVVVLCMENRSFDHYLGSLSLPGSAGGLGVAGIDGLRGGESNRSLAGGAITSHEFGPRPSHNLPHEWAEMHAMFRGGAMDGFVRAAEAAARANVEALQKNIDPAQRVDADELAALMASETMGYYTSEHLPTMYALARQAALCERWHSSIMGPTWPNRFYLHGGDAKGMQQNKPLGSDWESILDVVHESGLESKNFYHDIAWLRAANPSAHREARNIFEDMVSSQDSQKPTGFFARARANTLPALSIIDPHFGIFNPQDANDDHPDAGGGEGHDVRMGQALISSVVAAIASNRDQWNRTLLIITYDESGGFYDHVAPPTTFDRRSEFGQLGFRVPAMLVGPHVRRGCSIKTTFEHTSILSSVIRLFGTGWFENQDANARLRAGNDLLECLDADALEGTPHAPPTLPPVKLSVSAWRGRPMASRHAELGAVARRLPEIDRIKAADRGILERVLAEGERLGALRMVR
jgi:phospholipase C